VRAVRWAFTELSDTVILAPPLTMVTNWTADLKK
jgi:hypothetical protein